MSEILFFLQKMCFWDKIVIGSSSARKSKLSTMGEGDRS